MPISSAGHFTAQLYIQLAQGLPRLLDNPIGQLRAMLETIDLTELESIASPAQAGPTGLQPLPAADAFVAARKTAIERLAHAEQVFVRPPQSSAVAESTVPEELLQQTEVRSSESRSRASHLVSSARVAGALGDYKESIRLFTEALDLGSLQVSEQAERRSKAASLFTSRGKST